MPYIVLGSDSKLFMLRVIKWYVHPAQCNYMVDSREVLYEALYEMAGNGG